MKTAAEYRELWVRAEKAWGDAYQQLTAANTRADDAEHMAAQLRIRLQSAERDLEHLRSEVRRLAARVNPTSDMKVNP